MIKFENDYLEGTCPEILKKLTETNMEQTPGYGKDNYCNSAKEKIKNICNCPDAEINFLVGGTQTNMIVISSILKSYQCIISSHIGHINTLEAGAIESAGHKIITITTNDGKLSDSHIKELTENYKNNENILHTAQPGMVYISFPTEQGLLYTKKELENLYTTCKQYNLLLYIDGARLGYGLMSEKCDMTISDIAKNCDIFYIGGTKVGTLFGEAVVVTNKNIQQDFRCSIKQKGGLLAKGRLLGIQFDTLFENNLYFKLSKHAIDMAMKLKKAFTEKGYNFLYDSYTNQQFPILPNDVLTELSKNYSFAISKRIDKNNTAVRICTSWATKKENIDKLINSINNL